MKLHLGCGPKYIPGFVHVDLMDYEHIDKCVSVDALDFTSENSVELIYASHVLEHFGRNEVDRVLREWYRLVTVGESCKFEAVAKRYCKTGNISKLIAGLRRPAVRKRLS